MLAEAHLEELRRLYEDVRRCAPELDFQRPGIGFRKPRGSPGLAPHLSVWVLTDATQSPSGRDFGALAAATFRRYGRKLFARLVARSAVRADGRVGWYGLVLTWIGPSQSAGRAVGETLVLFADKPLVADFVAGALPATTFLAGVDLRAFDGQTEVRLPTLAVDDAEGGTSGEGC